MENGKEELLSLPEFISELRTQYGIELTRGTLQFYSSPKWRLLPPPTFKGRHFSHYPRKYLDRVRVILLLRGNHWKLSEIKQLFKSLPEDAIGRIVNESTPVGKVDWLIDSITRTDSSRPDLESALVNLLKAFLVGSLGKTLKDLYDKGRFPVGDSQEVILEARTEIEKKRKELFQKQDSVRELVNSPEFDALINDLLAEFRIKLEQPKENISSWIASKLSRILVPLKSGLKFSG